MTSCRPVFRAALFVGRCCGAASCAYAAANALGLRHSVWALVSALAVSQEKLHDTGASLAGRITGTVIGVGVAVIVSLTGSKIAMDQSIQIAIAIAICAAVARLRPALRVCMWTAPIAFLTGESGIPITLVAAHRGAEVILGALVGGTFHWAAEILEGTIERVTNHPIRSWWNQV